MMALELRIISCKQLKSFNFFQKLSTYTAVSIVNKNNNQLQQQFKTPIDRDGDANPEWNFDIRFTDLQKISIHDDDLFLEFDLFCGGIVFGIGGDKLIGQVRVPFKDLVKQSNGNGNGSVKYCSYQVSGTDGKPNGVLNFSCKFVVVENNEKIDEVQNEGGFYPVVPEVNYAPVDVNWSPITTTPSPEVYYAPVDVNWSPLTTTPTPEVYYSSPEVYYPPRPNVECCYPQPSVEMVGCYPPPPSPPPLVDMACCYSPPPPPMNGMYYPRPPPPPPLLLPHLFYPPPSPPAPYGYDHSGSYSMH